jgi:hypothetical protein
MENTLQEGNEIQTQPWAVRLSALPRPRAAMCDAIRISQRCATSCSISISDVRLFEQPRARPSGLMNAHGSTRRDFWQALFSYRADSQIHHPEPLSSQTDENSAMEGISSRLEELVGIGNGVTKPSWKFPIGCTQLLKGTNQVTSWLPWTSDDDARSAQAPPARVGFLPQTIKETAPL